MGRQFPLPHRGLGNRRLTTTGRWRCWHPTASGWRADLVVYGIGVVPNVALALEAGLTIDNGITVDANLLSSRSAHLRAGRRCILPLPAERRTADSPRIGPERRRPGPPDRRPPGRQANAIYRLALVLDRPGHAEAANRRAGAGSRQPRRAGEPGAQQVSVLCFAGERLLAVESCGRVGDHMAARKILARPPALTPAVAAAPGFRSQDVGSAESLKSPSQAWSSRHSACGCSLKSQVEPTMRIAWSARSGCWA
jgi:hypothetical protein